MCVNICAYMQFCMITVKVREKHSKLCVHMCSDCCFYIYVYSKF